jgi:hypothetical protein
MKVPRTVMGADMRGPLVVAAWCDPQSRKSRWFREDTLVGLLMVDDERFTFATPSGVEFSALRSQARLDWRRRGGFWTIPRFDLFTPQGSFRLYLSLPAKTAPHFGKHVAAEAGEQLSRAGFQPAAAPQHIRGGELAELFADSAEVSPLLGLILAPIGAVIGVRVFRRDRDAARALRAKMSSLPPGRPPAW